MSKFISASSQAIELDKTRVLLDNARVAAQAREKTTELQKLIEELKIDAVEKGTRLDHLQKRNNELSVLLSKAKEDAVVEFKVSKE